MKILNLTENAEISVSPDELIILKNALNEILNGIEVFEFQTRIGVSRAVVGDLMKQIQAVIYQLK